MGNASQGGSAPNSSPQLLRWKRSFNSKITKLVITDDNSSIAVGCEDGGIHLFNRRGELIWSYQGKQMINDIAISKDGSFIIAGSATNLFCLNRNGKMVWDHSIGRPVRKVDFSTAGKYITAGSENKYLYVVGITGEVIFKHRSTDTVQLVTISDDGNYFLVASGPSILFYSKGGHLQWKYTTRFDVGNIGLSDNGSCMIANSLAEIYCLDSQSCVLWKHVGHSVTEALAIAPKNDYIICGTRDNQVICYAANGKELWSHETAARATTIKIAREGEHILVGLTDGSVHLLNRHGRMVWKNLLDSAVVSMDISRPGTFLVASSEKNTIYLIENLVVYTSLLNPMQEQVEDYESLGVDITKPMDLMKDAREAFSKNDYQAGASLMKRVDHQLANELKKHALDIIPKAQTTVQTLAREGVEDAELQAMYQRAIRFMKTHDYYAALKQVEALEAYAKELHVIERERAKEEKLAQCVKFFEDVHSTIGQIKSKGVTFNAVDTLMKLAAEALNGRDLETAYSYIEKAKENAEKAERKHLIKRSNEKLKQMEDLIAEAREQELDVKAAAMLLRDAREAVANKAYGQVFENADRVQELLGEITVKSSPQYQNVLDEIQTTRGLIDSIGFSGSPEISRAEAFLADAYDLASQDPPKALDRANRAKIQVQKIQRSYERVSESIAQVRTKLIEAQALGLDGRGIIGLLEEAEFLLESGAFRRAKGYIQQAENQIHAGLEVTSGTEGLSEMKAVEIVETSPLEPEGFESDDADDGWPEPHRVEWESRSAPSPLPTTEPTYDSAVDRVICPKCGTDIPPMFNFCGKCGTKLGRLCSKCGTEVPEGFFFCGKCGTKIE